MKSLTHLPIFQEIAYKHKIDEEVPPLETLENHPAYKLRVKLNKRQKLTRDEKNTLTKFLLDSNVSQTVVVDGWSFSFLDVSKWYVIDFYGVKKIVSAVDKTSIKANRHGVKNIIKFSKFFG